MKNAPSTERRKTRWTFSTVIRAAAKKGDGWHVTDSGHVRCSKGLCPLGVVFYPRGRSNPMPSDAPMARLAAMRIAYASDSDDAPDRKALLKGLGL